MTLRREEDIERDFQIELERLQMDHIDYYLMHMLCTVGDWEKLCGWHIREWIAEKKRSGQIRQIGFSFHGSQEAFLELLDAFDWKFVQIQYNYSDPNYQAGVTGLRAAHERGLPVMIMEPMLGGRLATGLPKRAVECFHRAEPGSTPVSWAFRWLWNQSEVTVVLSGMNERAQLQENLRCADRAQVGSLTTEELAVYDEVRRILGESCKVHCTGCHYCMPCPQGVDIPTCFSACNAYYSIGKSTGRIQYMMSTMLGDRPSYASLCVKCGRCESRCPQHLLIRKDLEQVVRTMEGPQFRVERAGYKSAAGEPHGLPWG